MTEKHQNLAQLREMAQKRKQERNLTYSQIGDMLGVTKQSVSLAFKDHSPKGKSLSIVSKFLQETGTEIEIKDNKIVEYFKIKPMKTKPKPQEPGYRDPYITWGHNAQYGNETTDDTHGYIQDKDGEWVDATMSIDIDDPKDWTWKEIEKRFGFALEIPG